MMLGSVSHRLTITVVPLEMIDFDDCFVIIDTGEVLNVRDDLENK